MTPQRYVAGVDIGGTNTVFAFADEAGNLICRGDFPTASAPDAESFCRKLSEALQEAAKGLPEKAEWSGIGIGAPCANSISGIIEGATDLPWPSPIPLRSLMERFSGLPVRIANDANAAAVGEKIYGNAHGMNNFILMTLGTGVGSGIIVDGHLLCGEHSFAGELGHARVRNGQGRKCACGRTDCLQTYCSAKGIIHTAREFLSGTSAPSELRKIKSEELTSRAIAEAANRGDEIARSVYDFTGRMLGDACADFASFSDPEAIILFGGVAKAGELLTRPMREAFEDGALHLYRGRVKILLSGLDGARAAILGAAALAWDRMD